MAMDILNKKNSLRFPILLLSIIVFTTVSFASIADNYKITQKQKVIAGAIYKFIKFVEWDQLSTKNQKNFIVCLQQYDPAFEPFMERTIANKPIKLQLLNQKSNPKACHVIFFNRPQRDSGAILQTLTNPQSILTISAQPGFITQGGIIELGSHNNRLTFSINLAAAKANHLNIGFQLLSLADHVIKN